MSLKKSIVLYLYFVPAFLFGTEYVNIGIIEHYNIQRFSFLVEKGTYQVFADNNKITEIPEGELLYLICKGNSIEVKSSRLNFGTFSKVYLIGRELENVFRVTPIEPDKDARTYDDNLKVTLKKNALRLVNNIDMENYIAGVVQAEVGPTPAPEFFKLQSILCRTYALENRNKHQHEGYNLCDRVHCQAYYKKCTESDIEAASKSTKGLVIVDSDINLITAAFYSNCGGQTVNSEDVWQKPVYYLKSVKDPYCITEPNAVWNKRIPKSEWQSYLAKKAFSLGIPPESVSVNPFRQKQRLSHFPIGDKEIPLKTIRSDWRLKSTFFETTVEGEFVLLNGRGFGHGAGLCQEGAMRMAAKGISYPEILHFYYKNVHLINMDALDFFKE